MPKAYELPAPGTTFDPQRWKLGALCKRGHDWADSQSLRHAVYGYCAFCRSLPEAKVKRAKALAEKRKRHGRPSRSKHGLPYTPKQEPVVYEMRAAIRRAGNLPSVAKLVQIRQHQHWSTNPEDRRAIQTPWKVQKAQWLYLTDHSYRLYQRQKSKHYKATKRGNHSALIPGAQLLNRWAEFGYTCAYCGKPDHRASELELDHVIPISKGGAHHLGNIVPACRQCNHSKFFHEAFAWYQQQPFYSKTRWEKICAILNKESPKWQQMRLI
jgi:5-methylcytosine-specific restriction endonuclease McrA